MPVWPAPPVDLQPEVRLHAWRVFRVPLGNQSTYHLVGLVDAADARVCSPIQSFDPVKKRLVTRSGRVYTLVGEMYPTAPGDSSDCGYLLSRWLTRNGLTHADVTFVDDFNADEI